MIDIEGKLPHKDIVDNKTHDCDCCRPKCKHHPDRFAYGEGTFLLFFHEYLCEECYWQAAGR